MKVRIRPSYQRLQSELAEIIAQTPPGDRLQSEPALAKSLGVSRATLRESMRAFEIQGVIRRRQGVGTFVVSHTHVIDSGLEVLESIETMAKKIGLDVSMGALEIENIDADAEIAEKLQIKRETPLVKVSRVIMARERPVAFLIDVLPEDVLTESDLRNGFTGSVIDLLMQRGSPSLANSLTEIRPAAAAPDIARALQIQRGDVLQSFIACLIATDGRVVDYSTSYFLPGYFRFQVIRRVGGDY